MKFNSVKLTFHVCKYPVAQDIVFLFILVTQYIESAYLESISAAVTKAPVTMMKTRLRDGSNKAATVSITVTPNMNFSNVTLSREK